MFHMSNVNVKFKDNVFLDLFSSPENQLNLYQSLHPEDTTTTEQDIEEITLDSLIVNDIYNDLSLLVKDSIMIFVEAQSTWSDSILIRLLFYMAQSLQEHIVKKDYDYYATKALRLPKIELYVVYTGEKGCS